MRLFCVGERFFCDFFAWAGADFAVCDDADEAARRIAQRASHEEIVFVSGSLAAQKSRALERHFNDPSRIVVPIPSPSGEAGYDARSVYQSLLGGGT
jgi:vacuolar-type H+-ATPase subunit F/Vma7